MKTNKLGLIAIVIATLCTLLIGFFITVSCEEPKALNTTQSDDPALRTTQDTIVALAGTTWKLAGIVNTQTGEMKILEPQDCSKCYTLTFLTDSTTKGLSVSYPMAFNLSLLGSYSIEDIGEPADGDLFRNALGSPNTNSYTVTTTELRFINNVDNYYLLFNPYKFIAQ
jgi:hypothetical protein